MITPRQLVSWANWPPPGAHRAAQGTLAILGAGIILPDDPPPHCSYEPVLQRPEEAAGQVGRWAAPAERPKRACPPPPAPACIGQACSRLGPCPAQQATPGAPPACLAQRSCPTRAHLCQPPARPPRPPRSPSLESDFTLGKVLGECAGCDAAGRPPGLGSQCNSQEGRLPCAAWQPRAPLAEQARARLAWCAWCWRSARGSCTRASPSPRPSSSARRMWRMLSGRSGSGQRGRRQRAWGSCGFLWAVGKGSPEQSRAAWPRACKASHCHAAGLRC